MKDINNISGPGYQEQEWQHPDFAWDAMKSDIFQKIEEEDPAFFNEKEDRRVIGVWLFTGGMVGLLLCIGIGWMFLSNHATLTPSASNDTENLSNHPITQSVTHIYEPQATSSLKNESKTSIEIEAIYKGDKVSSLLNKKENRTTNDENVVAKAATVDPVITIHSHNHLARPSVKETQITTIAKNTPTQPLTPFMLPVLVHGPLSIDLTNKLIQGSTPEQALSLSKKMHKPKWQVTATGGSLMSFSKYTGKSQAVALRNDHTSPWFGYHYGVNVEKSISRKTKIFAGIDRVVAYQNIDISTERMVEVEQENVLLDVTHYVVGTRTEYRHGDTTVTGVERNRLVHYNELRSLQFNIGASRIYQLNKRWTLSPYAGVATAFLTRQIGTTVLADGAIESFDNDNPIFTKFQYKVLAGVNIEYALGRQFSLLSGYRFDSQLNDTSKEPDMRWKPAHHYISLGVSYLW